MYLLGFIGWKRCFFLVDLNYSLTLSNVLCSSHMVLVNIIKRKKRKERREGRGGKGESKGEKGGEGVLEGEERGKEGT